MTLLLLARHFVDVVVTATVAFAVAVTFANTVITVAVTVALTVTVDYYSYLLLCRYYLFYL